jgi:tetratricopeptide (TPR) repeat protein
MLGPIPSLLEPVEKARELMAANHLLRCFEAQAYAYDGWSKRVEGDIDSSIATYKRGLELAESHDESLHRYMNLGGLGDALKDVSIKEAAARFEESYSVVQDLEVPYLESEVLHDSGLVFEVAGEYDLAMAAYLESLKAWKFNERGDYQSLPLIRVYVLMGNSLRALEMIDRYCEYVEPIETIIVPLLKAWALALTDKLGDAERTLETAYSMMIKSGFEQILGDYYHISGVIELRKGNFLDAIGTIEKAWKIAERKPSGLNQNRALLDLARAEILLDKQSIDSTKVVAPGKWLCKLEDFAVQRELPGIRIQAALLKSELYQNHGQLKDAHAVLVDALDTTDSKGVATLRKRITSRIQEIDHLLREKELAS